MPIQITQERNPPAISGVLRAEGYSSMKESMARLKSIWRWTAFNLFAVSTLTVVLTQGSADWSNEDAFDPMLESGKWAIRFLLICLSITPLNTYFGWSAAIKLRKSAGLWAFGFASLHVLLYIREARLEWLRIPMPLYLALGLVAVGILSALAATSNRWAMKRLGKNWKRLHRLVYLAGISVVTHSLLAVAMSKKIFIRDPQAQSELKVYLAVLAALLVVRIPLVRQLLMQIPMLLRHRHKPVSPVPAPDIGVESLPRIHGCESGVSLKPTFIIPNEIPKPSEWSRSGGSLGKLKGFAERYADTLPEEKAEVR